MGISNPALRPCSTPAQALWCSRSYGDAGRAFSSRSTNVTHWLKPIRNRLNELAERFNIREIAIDRWNATQLSTQLTGDGFEVVGFGQGFASMSAPTKELEKRLLGKTIGHGGNPVLRWMASNVATEIDAAGNVKVSKKKSTERIDGIVAAIMALGRVISNDEGSGLYEAMEFDFV